MQSEHAYKSVRREDFKLRACILKKKKRPPKRTFDIDRRIQDPIYEVANLAVWEDRQQSVLQPDLAQSCGSLPVRSGHDTLQN